jgi:hypothetical protein
MLYFIVHMSWKYLSINTEYSTRYEEKSSEALLSGFFSHFVLHSAYIHIIYYCILHFMFLFSLFVFVSAAGHYFRIWTGHYFSIWTGQVPALSF